MIVAAFLSDRGELHIDECLASFADNVDMGLISATEVFDDRTHTLGLAGNVQEAWKWALETGADFLFHVEEDFRFLDAVPLREMRMILTKHAHLAQVVLKRQPWSEEEKARGDITKGTSFIQMHDGKFDWIEHDTIFSLNPCLIPRDVLELGWPSGPLGVGNETGMTKRCLDKGLSFAYYGHRTDPPRVLHVGDVRAAGWKL